MFSRINLLKIVVDHYGTLKSINSYKGRITIYDLILFFGVPLGITLYLMFDQIDIKENLSNFITAISILCGFLFNLLAVIYGLMDKLKADLSASDRNNSIRSVFIKYIHSNISYNILLSIILIVMLLIYSCLSAPNTIFSKIILSISYFLLIQFFLTLLMILNRVYILMKKEN